MLNVTPNNVMRNDFFLKPVFQGDIINNALQIEDHFGGFGNTGINGGLDKVYTGKPNVQQLPVIKASTGLDMIIDNIPLILLGIAISILIK